MAEHEGIVVSDGFVPFEPRRAADMRASPDVPLSPVDTQPMPGMAEAQMSETPAEAGGPVVDADSAATGTATMEASVEAATTLHAAAQEQQESMPVSIPCDHSLDIRNEAIRLAAIACGRALRHAALLHPRTIAGFVDDAIVAAGNPGHARIHLHPGAIGERHDADHERIGDANLGYGDVIVECDDTSLSADIERRAKLLARAAAEQ
jgi:hypothetical protein